MGYVLDLLLGDPFGSFHPVVWIGKIISAFTQKLLKENDSSDKKRKKGILLVVIVITILKKDLPLSLLNISGYAQSTVIVKEMNVQITVKNTVQKNDFTYLGSPKTVE